jgi:preprotein translocase subunit YajC
VAFIIVLVAMLVLMYFLLIRPQRAQQRRAQDMLSQLKPGDEIITVGGIYGDVVEVEDEKVVLEIAEDVQIEVARKAIANIVPPETELEDEAPEALEEAEDAAVEEPEELEPAATDAEEELAGEPEPAEPVKEGSRPRFGRRSK